MELRYYHKHATLTAVVGRKASTVVEFSLKDLSSVKKLCLTLLHESLPNTMLA
jgi:hypothetical protein